MVDRKVKIQALRDAIDIAKNYGRSGNTTSPSVLIADAYRAIIKIADEIDTSEKQDE